VSAGALGLIVALVLAFTVGSSGSGSNKATATTTVAPTTASSTTVHVVKRCVGLRDQLPRGAPAMPITAGAPPTRLVTKDLKVGTGPVVPRSAKVQMNYVLVACSTGKIVDSSYSRNQSYEADLSPAGGLIPAWQQGIPGMHVGGVRLLEVPPSLGYGASGTPPRIGPNEPLFFVVEAVKLG
jgi:peptidylprolyl isomerase